MRTHSLRARWLAACLGMVVTVGGAVSARTADDSAQQRYRHSRSNDDHRRFDERDRAVVRDWYVQERYNVPRRVRDGLPGGWAVNVRIGNVFGSNLRAYVSDVPYGLSRRLGPVPRGYRYVFIGDRLCLLDNRNRIVDVIPIDRRW